MAINPAVLRAVRALSYLEGDINRIYKAQRALETIGAKLLPAKPNYEITDYNIRVFDHAVPLRKFRAPDASEKDIILFFHGGGWVTGNIDSYDRVCQDISTQCKQTVFSVDYRLAPEHKFPAALLDCYNVAQRFLSGSLGYEAHRITLMGDSAGGNLAAAVSLLAKDAGEVMPPRQILIYPSVASDRSQFASFAAFGEDYLLTAKRVEDFQNLYASKPADFADPFFSPILADDLSGQPETLVITADCDVLCDEGEAYAKRLQEAGVSVTCHRLKDALHGIFTLPPTIEPVAKCYEHINDFFAQGGETH